MKAIKHTIYKVEREDSLEDHEYLDKMFHVFEWANKMGREGRVLTGIAFEPTAITCLEYVTDDQYSEMLMSGKIVETPGEQDGRVGDNGEEQDRASGTDNEVCAPGLSKGQDSGDEGAATPTEQTDVQIHDVEG